MTALNQKKEIAGVGISASLIKSNLYPGLSVYAEVRGKYARPAPLLNQAVNIHTQNPVLYRPSTSGSLRPKSSCSIVDSKGHINLLEKKDLLDNNVPRPPSALSDSKRSNSSKRSHKSHRYSKVDYINESIKNNLKYKEINDNVKGKTEEYFSKNNYHYEKEKENKITDLNEVILEKQLENDNEKLIQNNIENDVNPENIENIENLEGKDIEKVNSERDKNLQECEEKSVTVSSRSSWKTTSSQRRYIRELEALLREEKIKRIKLEEMLNQVISK